MGKTEIYLWGTLLALVREQLAAIDEHVAGKLGFWGKARFSSRTRAIQKFVIKLRKKKAEAHGDSTIHALVADLDYIADRREIWADITPEQVTYVRRILVSLVEQ